MDRPGESVWAEWRMVDERIAEIVEAMQRDLSPELVTALTDLPITEVPEALDVEPEMVIEPYDPANPDTPQGPGYDCGTIDEDEDVSS